MKNKNYLYGLLLYGFIAGFTSPVSAEIRQCDKEFISSDDSHIVYMGRISRSIPHIVRFTYFGLCAYPLGKDDRSRGFGWFNCIWCIVYVIRCNIYCHVYLC